MKYAAVLVAILVAGCHLGGPDDCVDADDVYDPACDPPPGDDDPTAVVDGALGAETTLFDDVVTFVTRGDATVIAMLRVDATEVRLVLRDVRFPDVTELDRMPIGDGVPQILDGREAIVWGFGGTVLDGGTFRSIEDGVARQLDFATHTPSVLLNQHTNLLAYASMKDCRVEKLELTTGAFEEWGTFSCFADLNSVALDEFQNIWLRVVDDSGTAIGMMDGQWPGMVSVAMGNMQDAVGPFVGVGSYWLVDNVGANEANFHRGATGQWPVLPAYRIATLATAFDTATLVDEMPWAANRGTPSYLFRVAHPTTVRYPVAYDPVKMLGLHGRLIVQLANGRLVEQLTDEL